MVTAPEAAASTQRPKLRGWQHLIAAPIVLVSGIALLVAAPNGAPALAIYTAAATGLFAVSAAYHRIPWTATMREWVGRADHSMIFIIIAASYTPVALAELPPEQARALLIVVWAGALAGVCYRFVWFDAPRWLTTPLYLVVGWSILPYAGTLAAAAPVAMALIALSGLCYTAGAVVYWLKRPNPAPRWFGFHEVFHSFTIAGWSAHFGALWLILAR